MSRPIQSNPGGIHGIEVGAVSVKNIGKTIEFTSSDASVVITGDDIAKTVDFKIDVVSQILECSFDVSVGDIVYIGTGGILGKAKADSALTMPAIGIVTVKTDSTHCRIDLMYLQESLSGILNNSPYFVSSSVAGALTSTVPTTPTHRLQQVARGIGTDKLLININPANVVVRS